MPWLNDWEKEVKSRKDVKGEAKKRLRLSDETLLGLRMTGKNIIPIYIVFYIILKIAFSFIDLITYLFEETKAKSFLSERICQDPLEKYFGRQRQRGAVNENPTVHQFLKNNQALRIVDSIKLRLTLPKETLVVPMKTKSLFQAYQLSVERQRR